MVERKTIAATILLTGIGLCAAPVRAQVISAMDANGRRVFINADEPVKARKPLPPAKANGNLPGRTTIFAPVASFPVAKGAGQQAKPALGDLDRIVHEASARHSVDPALVRAVIETESSWNPAAVSRRGAVGLMQLVPGTAKRLGVDDAMNPEHNVDGGVRYLRTLLDRYNGNLDLALAAYNAGEGAVDRHGGIPPYRETRNYVQKVTEAYYRPGSGRLAHWWNASHAIHKETDEHGRVVFTNE